jgi:hypothetical protein
MHTNKNQFGRAITPVSAADGAQRIARPTKHDNFGCSRLLYPSVTSLASAEFFHCGD